MSEYSENFLVYPSIIAMGKRSGSISTSDLIVELVDVLQPDGKDAQLLSGRNDSYFSQKVRNLKAHKTLEKLGFASVTADGWKFTSDGQMLYDRICQMLKPAFSAVTRENLQDTSHPNLLTALRTKPFLLLAGISGTGKSRIVRELARACWQPTDDEYKAHKPRNFEMVQVKPNWHDSSELIGYVSRIGEKPEFIAGDFLKFVAKAWSEPTVPYFLCLDEMNLAPVEQYFAEYLSVIESRKLEDGKIVTDPLLKKEAQEWYHTLVSTITDDGKLHEQFLNEGIAIPQNLFVVGTVNMDETTFSFSRKVLDRAMTIEMNEVDLTGGLETDAENEFGYIGPSEDGTASPLIPQVVEGKDVYSANKELCGKVIEFLTSVNQVLDKTPFKIAYRTRNEFLVYAVCRGEENLSNALDEMTSMKILSRIEGDAEKTERVLNDLSALLKTTFGELDKSVSLIKIEEMLEKLNRTQYTSFWS